jgi:hypothetical protein
MEVEIHWKKVFLFLKKGHKTNSCLLFASASNCAEMPTASAVICNSQGAINPKEGR